jgi:lipooligosaccharide transport system ATP-binding protein
VVELRFPEEQMDGISDRLAWMEGNTEVLADRVIVYTDDAEGTQHELNTRDIYPEQVLVRRSSLEDVFLKLTGRSLVD